MTGAGPRILMTIHRLSFGGADRVAVLLANALQAAGLQTRLAVLRDGGEGEDSLTRLLDPEVEVVRAGPALGSRHLELLRGYRFLKDQIGSWQPDLVLASSNNMGLVTGLAARAATARPSTMLKFTNPVVRPCDWWQPRRCYRKQLYRNVLGRFDRILTLSDAECADLSRLYPHLAPRIGTVANPYVTDAMLCSRPRTVGAAVRIVTCGRMMPQKRHDRLIEAFAQLAVPDAELVVVGDGPLRPMLEAGIVRLGLTGRVHLPGFKDDVVPWLRDADLFVLSSDYEGFPAAVVEALACGVPVVTTDCFVGARALLSATEPCMVTPRGDTFLLAQAMQCALRVEPDRGALRALVEPYQIEAASQAHVAAVRAAVEPRRASAARRS